MADADHRVAVSDEALRTEFHAQTARIDWRELQPHYARGSVIVVGEGLDLVEVAMQMRRDNAGQFEAWIAEGRLAAVNDSQARLWFEQDPEVWAVVVPPWVLVQQVSE